MLIQGSACIYSKKGAHDPHLIPLVARARGAVLPVSVVALHAVEHLYTLVYNTLNHIVEKKCGETRRTAPRIRPKPWL